MAAKKSTGGVEAVARKVTLLDRIVAVTRFTTSRQFRVRTFLGEYYSPPLAAIIGVVGIMVWGAGKFDFFVEE